MLKLRRHGFTLVEIMIVVAIIALLAAIAIPNLLRARHNANEAAAIASCRTLSTALESYRANQTPVTYPSTAQGLAILGSVTPAYIDSILAGGSKQGYGFTYAAGAVRTVTIAGVAYSVYDTYAANGNPITPGTTGTRGFYVDQTGVIRVASPAPAGATSTPLE